MEKIKFIENTNKKEKPDQNNLGFGVYFTDSMFVMDYKDGVGWYDPRIEPYGPLSIEPSAMVLHYGQEVFEGLKTFHAKDNGIALFRPKKNIARLNFSSERLGIPTFDSELIIEAMIQLVRLEKEWIPTLPGTSLYIRPFIIATEPHVGVRQSKTYKFLIILSPVGAYYQEGFNPVKIYVEDQFVRAVRGGIGAAKAGGNYAASIKAQMEAKKHGFSQVLWLDGVERKYIDEVGTMNIFFKINNEIITPHLDGSILEGVTRGSVIELVHEWGYKVTERKISIQEVYEAYKNKTLEEAFGTGTAAIISSIGELCWNNENMILCKGKTGDLSQKLFDTITNIQNGSLPDKHGWLMRI